MLSDYEEDDMFEGSINSSKLEEQAYWSSFSSKLSSLSKSSSPSLDELENDVQRNMISKLNNTHLLKLLSDLVQTFFQVTHEIENYLNSHVNKKQNQTIEDLEVNSIQQIEEMPTRTKMNEINNLKNDLRDSACSDDSNPCLKVNRESQHVNQYDDETVCENVIPYPKLRQIKTHYTQSFQNKNQSKILKESSTVNKNSNYYEISCSYIVQLNKSKNCEIKNRIIEDKKPYISASINVNNCYKSKKEHTKSVSFDSDEDEAFSDATDDFSDSFECPSYNFQLKNKSTDQPGQILNAVKSISCYNQTKDQQRLNELIKQKMELFNQSLINLAQCERQANVFIDKNLNGNFEIDKLESNYLDFLEQEDSVLEFCTRFKGLIQQLIQLIKSISANSLDDTLKDILNRNADLSARQNYLKKEIEQIHTTIKNLFEKESNYKVETINYQHLLDEVKQNQDRVNWLKDQIDKLTHEIDLMKKEQRTFEFKNCDRKSKKDLSLEEEEIFEDCLENLEDSNNTDEGQEIMLFDKVQFENVCKSIQHSSEQRNMMNLMDCENHELLIISNKLKSEIEQTKLSNEELVRRIQCQHEDKTQHLNCLKKRISSNKKFLNEQNYDRDHEKDTFDNKLTRMKFLIKEKDLNLVKCNEKFEFLKTDLDELMSEKDVLQCKSYNQERKLIDILSKQEELKQELEKLEKENHISFYRQEQIRNRVEEYQTYLDKEKLQTDKLKFNDKLELDPEFYETLDKVIKEINKFQMKEKIREHLYKRSIEKRESAKRKCLNMQKKLTRIDNLNCLTPIKSSKSSTPFSSIRSKSFAKSKSSTPVRTNSFSLNKVPATKVTKDEEIKFRRNSFQTQSFKIPRSKSFMDDEFDRLSRLNPRYSLKQTEDSYSKFVSMLKSPSKRVLDDDDFYSFKECSSLISLNNDLMDDFVSLKSDSLFSSTSDNLDDQDMQSVDENFNSIPLSIDAQRSLSEDTFYFSLTSEDAIDDCHFDDLYSELERCKDAEKLKYYASNISKFFKQIMKSINQCRDAVHSTTLDNKNKQVKVAELEKSFDQLKSIVNNEAFDLERLQNMLNQKHLEISELKNQMDSNQDNSLFIENKQILNDLDTSMIENEENQFILQSNLQHLEASLKKRILELKDYTDQLLNLKKMNSTFAEQNQNLRVDNEKLEKENLDLRDRLKKLREVKLYKKLKTMKKDTNCLDLLV